MSVSKWKNVLKMFIKAWIPKNCLITLPKVLRLKFLVWKMSKRLFCCKWQAEWRLKLKIIWESEAKLTSLCSETLESPNPNSSNTSLTSHHGLCIQRAKAVRVWVWLQLLWLIQEQSSFHWKLGLWCLQTWVYVVSMNSIRWRNTTGLQSMKSWSSKQFQLQKLV